MLNEADFNRVELETFWRFIHERHSIWHRRFVLGLSRSEWTQDEVLKRNKFTNIYRELDPGTKFAMENILEREDASRPDRVFNVMLYRLMCSIPTYSAFGFRTLDKFRQEDLDNCLCEIYNSGNPVFGNAYLISPYSSMGSPFKFRNVSRLFGQIHQNFADFFRQLDEAPTFERAFKVVTKQYGFGPFLAYQVMVDLTYPLPNTKYRSAIIPFNQDDWARLGPGALRGYARLAPRDYMPQALKGLRWLRENQRKEFDRLDLQFPFLRDASGREVELTLANLQNCLCEYHKYRSIQDEVGKAQRIFVPTIRGAETGRFRWNDYTGRYE